MQVSLIDSSVMDKFAFRRSKLKSLIDTEYGGVRAAFARATGIDPTYVSRLLYEETKPGFKRISDEIMEKVDKVHPCWLATGKGSKELGASNVAQLQPASIEDQVTQLLAGMPDYYAEAWISKVKGHADMQRAEKRAAQEVRQQLESDRAKTAKPIDGSELNYPAHRLFLIASHGVRLDTKRDNSKPVQLPLQLYAAGGG